MNKKVFKISISWFHIVCFTLMALITFELLKQNKETEKLNSIFSQDFIQHQKYIESKIQKNLKLIKRKSKFRIYKLNYLGNFQDAINQYKNLSDQLIKTSSMDKMMGIDALTNFSFWKRFYDEADIEYLTAEEISFVESPYTLSVTNHKHFIQFKLNWRYDQIFDYFLRKLGTNYSLSISDYSINSKWISGSMIPLGKQFIGIIYLAENSIYNPKSTNDQIDIRELKMFVNGIEFTPNDDGTFDFSEIPTSKGTHKFKVEAYWQSNPHFRYSDVFKYYVR